MSRYVIRATHEDGRRFCREVTAQSLAKAFIEFLGLAFIERGVLADELTTIDIDRMDEEDQG